MPSTAEHRNTSQQAEPSQTRMLKRGRKVNQMMELRLMNIKARVDRVQEMENDRNHPDAVLAHPPVRAKLNQNIVMGVHDIKVVDRLTNSPYNNLLFHWSSRREPRGDDSDMMSLHLMEISSSKQNEKIMMEYRLRCKFLPLRVNLAQAALKHMHHMLNFQRLSDKNSRSSSRLRSQTPKQKNGEGSLFFQTFEIQQIPVKMDYQPQATDFQAIRDGNMAEVLNLLPIEGMEIVLKNVKLHAVEGVDGALVQCVSSWVENIYHEQLYQYLAGVDVPPLRSLSRLGQGAANLVLLPLRNYREGRRLGHGAMNDIESFVHTTAVETMNTVSSLAAGTKTLLEHLDDIVAPRETLTEKSTFNSSSVQHWKGNGQSSDVSSHADQPQDLQEGLRQGYESLHKNLTIAKHVIVAVPVGEYKRSGWKGAVKSVIRAVPVAVLRPVIGATEAVSRTAMGIRNAMDPEIKRDLDVKFKSERGHSK